VTPPFSEGAILVQTDPIVKLLGLKLVISRFDFKPEFFVKGESYLIMLKNIKSNEIEDRILSHKNLIERYKLNK
jgi:hypothetical protein